ncbi:MAG: TonB family protein [Kiritimatiellae bacterium]|nr:TonB family protein [Kiritimatiellia bacterium]
MNRWTDFLVSFGLALLLHGVLVLGAVWFWTLRPSALRPVFQGGDTSLAVTFVAAEADEGKPARLASGIADAGGSEIDNQTVDTAEILTDPEADLPEEAPVVAQPNKIVAAEPPSEEEEDQDMFDAEAVAPVPAQASAKVPATGPQNANQASKSTGAPSGARSQGVSGGVRMQSEIRPYYPLGARLRGEEGAATVRVWVNNSGRARRCEVVRSSGYPALDQAAVDAARRARYVSTQPGAWHAETETTLTFRFRLTE